jgi:hypothetical protein
VAEAGAECAEADAPALAAKAARQQRRGCTTYPLYVPEGLVRCARLLRHSAPGEAAALVQVSRRWVREALQRVPPESRHSFVSQVAVNRMLLDVDEQAVYVQPLR